MTTSSRRPVAVGGALTAAGAATGPVLAAFGLVPPVAAVLLCAAALAAGGSALVSTVRRRRGEAGPVAVPSPEPDPTADLDRLAAVMAGKVPPAIQARVDRIARTVREILPRMDQIGPGSLQAHAVVATATSYLPEAVGAYLRLPRDYADRRPVSAGKTSLMVLCDQLDLLANRMDEVFIAVCQADSDALIAHGRFLAEKFGSGSLTVAAPPLGTPNQ